VRTKDLQALALLFLRRALLLVKGTTWDTNTQKRITKKMYYLLIDYVDNRYTPSFATIEQMPKTTHLVFKYDDKAQAIHDYWFMVDHLMKSMDTTKVWTDIFLIDKDGQVINESKL
jgi:hypothetical protein